MKKKMLVIGVTSALTMLAATGLVSATTDGAVASNQWKPAASERLIRLDPRDLRKAVKRDFKGSSLAQAISVVKSQISQQRQTIEEIQESIASASTESAEQELQHQSIEARQQLIELQKQQLALKDKKLAGMEKVYKKLLKKMGRLKKPLTPEESALMRQQQEVATRMARSEMMPVDYTPMALSARYSDSGYSAEYAKIEAASQQLRYAIANHSAAQRDDRHQPKLSKMEELQQILSETEAQRALIPRERELLGMMAKLLSLDSKALAQRLTPDEEPESEESFSPTTVTDLFISSSIY